MERRHRTLGEQYAGWCIHYTGIQHDTCKQGINYLQLAGGEQFGMAKRLPCLRGNEGANSCALCHYPTSEEVAAHEAEIEAYTARRRVEAMAIGALHEGQEGASTVYLCLLCDPAAPAGFRSGREFVDHATGEHGLDTETVRTAQGQMAAHLDATTWHQTDDRFTLPDGRPLLLRSTRVPRRGADRAMWEVNTGKGRRRGR